MNIIKIAGAWGCIIGAVVLMVLVPQPVAIPVTLALLSIAFSQAPV